MKSIVALFAVAAIAAVSAYPTYYDADNAAAIAKCRADEAKAYADETIEINRKNVDALIAETDPEKKTELIKSQNEARLERTKLRVSAIQTDACAKANNAQRIVVSSASNTKNAADIAKCRAAEAKDYADESVKFERNNTDALIAESDPEKKTELIKEQNKARLQRNKIRIAAIRADVCAQNSVKRIVGSSLNSADKAAAIAKCRSDEALSFSDETIEINQKDVDALIAESDPERKTELIKAQNEARLARNKLRIAAIREDKCAKKFDFTSTAAPVVQTTTATLVVATEPIVVATEAPVVVTEAPIVATEAPVVVTEAPIVATEAPIVATEAPVVAATEAVVETPVVVTEAALLPAATEAESSQ